MKLAVKYSTLFGEVLRSKRKCSPFRGDQIRLSHHMGVTGSTVSRWETGEVTPRVDQFAKISQILGFKPSNFYEQMGEVSHRLQEKGVQVIFSEEDDINFLLSVGEEDGYVLLSGKALREMLKNWVD